VDFKERQMLAETGAGSAHLLLSGFMRVPVAQAASLSAVTELALDCAIGSLISQIANL